MSAATTDPGDEREVTSPDRSSLLSALQVDVSDELLTLALTHRSFAYENGGLPTNERLEFLGDSVLGVIVTEKLYRNFPDRPEGELAKIRASVVNMHALADIARGLGDGGLGAFIMLGKGEELTGGRDKSSILADGMESIIGAVYLDNGLEVSRGLISRLFDEPIAHAAELGAGLDWKTSLQELTAERGLGVPGYQITSTGPDHDKEFTATAVVSGRQLGRGVGRTKKEAEQKAAATAWRTISESTDAQLRDGVGSADGVGPGSSD
ncbi:ribonuclease III [Gordonia jinhuaensis]|uniref:Ribonuclease 3 n=1 Tax=Gordonia jinhuaensis TaxID=1517702 RepID=A0A916T3U4_9ACTN|nr:ribonuclease III [Gordonia jinhuaensis]GGB30411.1 ribonuclease 3 [Gordonia jinhuaensis]